MKTKNIKDIKSKEKDSWALPGNAISMEDFQEGIKKAERGRFYTVEESKQKLEGWRKKRNSR
jgi:hypothetical protein